MDFVRRHLFFILCGAGCALGIGLGVTGLQAMPKVMTELQAAGGVFRSLEGLQSQPVNPKAIDAEKRRIQLIVDDRSKVLETAKQLRRYEPLVPGVLPDGPSSKRLEFRAKYAAEMSRLLDSLNWGGPATAAEVDVMKDKIENERAEQRIMGGDVASGPAGARSPADVLTRTGVQSDANARADVAAAQRIYCYAVKFFDEKPPDRVASLEFLSAMKDTGTVDAPELEDIWEAQVGFWIQKDVVDAIVVVNQEAADAAKAAKEHHWVGIMPVKDIISIRISSEYIPPEGEIFKVASPGGFAAALPPATAASVFTGSGSGPAYDVLQFTVKLVMDQRDIPLLVERVCNNSFHTLLRAAYVAVPPNKSMTGKIYGAEPTVNVVLDFETIMLADVFRPFMPDAVCEKFEIPCPKRDATKSEEQDDEG